MAGGEQIKGDQRTANEVLGEMVSKEIDQISGGSTELETLKKDVLGRYNDVDSYLKSQGIVPPSSETIQRIIESDDFGPETSFNREVGMVVVQVLQKTASAATGNRKKDLDNWTRMIAGAYITIDERLVKNGVIFVKGLNRSSKPTPEPIPAKPEQSQKDLPSPLQDGKRIDGAFHFTQKHHRLLIGIIGNRRVSDMTEETYNELLDLLPILLDPENTSKDARQIKKLFEIYRQQSGATEDEILELIESRGNDLIAAIGIDKNTPAVGPFLPKGPIQPSSAIPFNSAIASGHPNGRIIPQPQHRERHVPEKDELTKEEMDLMDVNLQLNADRTDFEHLTHVGVVLKYYAKELEGLSGPEHAAKLVQLTVSYHNLLDSIFSKLRTYRTASSKAKTVDGMLKRYDMFPVFEGVYIAELVEGMKRESGYQDSFHFRKPQVA